MDDEEGRLPSSVNVFKFLVGISGSSDVGSDRGLPGLRAITHAWFELEIACLVSLWSPYGEARCMGKHAFGNRGLGALKKGRGFVAALCPYPIADPPVFLELVPIQLSLIACGSSGQRMV